MIQFSKDKVLLLHKLMAEATGGSIGLRDEGLPESALEGIYCVAKNEVRFTVFRFVLLLLPFLRYRGKRWQGHAEWVLLFRAW